MGFTVVFTPAGATAPAGNVTLTGISNISIAPGNDRSQPPSIILGGGVGGSSQFPAGGGIIPIAQVVSIAIS